MEKDTIRQVIMLVVSSIILYFSGIYLMSIGNLKSLFDGFIVMIFFFAIFPFLSLLTMLSIKFLKVFLSVKNY
jgi:hypothetical protein